MQIEQNVKKIAICDGYRLLAFDISGGRLFTRLNVFLYEEFPEELWLLSVHGIYRPLSENVEVKPMSSISSNDMLHPKYQLPAKCFAYVGSLDDPGTWSLPYLLRDESVDVKRLPKAISSIISNYRGKKVKKIPETEIPMVLKTLENAAREVRKMPDQHPHTSSTYRNLEEVLLQFK